MSKQRLTYVKMDNPAPSGAGKALGGCGNQTDRVQSFDHWPFSGADSTIGGGVLGSNPLAPAIILSYR